MALQVPKATCPMTPSPLQGCRSQSRYGFELYHDTVSSQPVTMRVLLLQAFGEITSGDIGGLDADGMTRTLLSPRRQASTLTLLLPSPLRAPYCALALAGLMGMGFVALSTLGLPLPFTQLAKEVHTDMQSCLSLCFHSHTSLVFPPMCCAGRTMFPSRFRSSCHSTFYFAHDVLGLVSQPCAFWVLIDTFCPPVSLWMPSGGPLVKPPQRSPT